MKKRGWYEWGTAALPQKNLDQTCILDRNLLGPTPWSFVIEGFFYLLTLYCKPIKSVKMNKYHWWTGFFFLPYKTLAKILKR